MRHAILVVGCEAHRGEPSPRIRLRDDESVREIIWLAAMNQESSATLLDDTKNTLLRLLKAPLLAYRFYLLVHSTKLWSGKRPLVLVRGRSLSSRVAAHAGKLGGGDVVKADNTNLPPLGPTRYLLDLDGTLRLRAD